MRTTRLTVLAAALAAAAALVPTSTAAATGRADVHLLTTDGTLVTGSSALPLLGHHVRVRGLDPRDRLTGIDVRPATGDLYGIGRSGRLYRIDPRTGRATGVGTPAPVDAAPVGFDFNPVVDRIRVVTASGTNLRLHPDTGAVAGTDGALAHPTPGEAPKVAAAAYTNSVAGATSTTLYVLDSSRRVLATQGTRAGVTPVVSPNTGQLFTVGKSTAWIGTTNGFDISAAGTALAASGGKVYRIDLDTGRTRLVGIAHHEIVGLAFTS
ncbi:DUF4394 domain-containing protein [Actinosynnema sp. NPDC047251]|uniref:DUF4394 domain-containing protein n=1 Tax=Saccharothrix espanaensis (strain ATCC 51144 / DSM 44229 / JCM 9112 / NBRC 15066 / NRRL 15764) TaxID=1179773 RepID=K0K211_SACES|nr:DUF4394 domain-containing protein [Saccharothrix espanaensis]CCH30909.1 hypothetical protein BN6_36140 [Saccharothrix espanaensis DSM 44229]